MQFRKISREDVTIVTSCFNSPILARETDIETSVITKYFSHKCEIRVERRMLQIRKLGYNMCGFSPVCVCVCVLSEMFQTKVNYIFEATRISNKKRREREREEKRKRYYTGENCAAFCH